MTLRDSLTEFLLAKDHTPSTRSWYRNRLGRFFGWVESQGITSVADMTAPLVRRYLDELRETPSKTTGRPLDSHTLHAHVRVIRAWMHWLADEGEMDPRVPSRIKPPKREAKVLRILNGKQIERLFLTAEQGTYHLRDRAILSVLLDTGLRANELCSLEREDVHITPEESYLLVRHGKGRRQREVPLGKTARLSLSRYLRSHREPWVFLSKAGGPLTTNGLDQVLYRLADRAGRQHFEGLKLGAHTYRHTFAVRYLEGGGDIYRLSRLMGHSQVTTTEGYLRAFTARQARQHSVSPLDRL